VLVIVANLTVQTYFVSNKTFLTEAPTNTLQRTSLGLRIGAGQGAGRTAGLVLFTLWNNIRQRRSLSAGLLTTLHFWAAGAGTARMPVAKRATRVI
jgi:hypothetical protein